MGVDIKLPIGLMFTILGVILTIHGAITSANTELYDRSLNININLWIGLIMLIFGISMLAFSKRLKNPKS
jgi:uncharacterized protein YhhL (DUF1145 family)